MTFTEGHARPSCVLCLSELTAVLWLSGCSSSFQGLMRLRAMSHERRYYASSVLQPQCAPRHMSSSWSPQYSVIPNSQSDSRTSSQILSTNQTTSSTSQQFLGTIRICGPLLRLGHRSRDMRAAQISFHYTARRLVDASRRSQNLWTGGQIRSVPHFPRMYLIAQRMWF